MPDPIDKGPLIPQRGALEDGLQESESFIDDAIAARQARETQTNRGDASRASRESEARIKQAQQRIGEASTFSKTYKQDQERRQRIFRESSNARSEGLRQGQQKVGKDGRIKDAEAIDHARVEELLGELSEILHDLESLGLDTLSKNLESDADLTRAQLKDGLGNMKGPIAARLHKMNRMLQRMHDAEFKVRMVLQDVLTGGTGVELLTDPRLTFRRVFDRLKKWPARVPPGRRPETDEEFDAFIQWVFEAPDAPTAEDMELLSGD